MSESLGRQGKNRATAQKFARCPTGTLDAELRLWLHDSGPVPQLVLQAFKYDLTGNAWQPVDPVLGVQLPFAAQLAELFQAAARGGVSADPT